GAVCCRAALATLDVIEEERLVERSRRLGDLIRERLYAMRETLPLLGDCRGLGLTIGQEIVDGEGNPDRDACARVCFRCWQRGLVLTFLGDNVLRIQPPLVITEEEALRGLEILRLALEDYRAGSIGDEALRFARGWS
ncbi:MAG: aminotransferase class III-fold pyridoxal phosphate-dependent enzyme, partial [Synergistales bacterium]|nr:aminotransferase class III-fold pyridoxal phosphate-dependent enzyme [Synergistales bacterium]